MALIVWSSRYELQVPEIDQQHRRLVDLVNELDMAMQQGQGKAAVGRVLEGLVAYTQYHFGHEEQLMEETRYPGSERHRREHIAFVKKLIDLRDAHRRGSLGLSIAVMTFLSDWLVGHIQGTDREFVPHVLEPATR
jgi:hemerythrin